MTEEKYPLGSPVKKQYKVDPERDWLPHETNKDIEVHKDGRMRTKDFEEKYNAPPVPIPLPDYNYDGFFKGDNEDQTF